MTALIPNKFARAFVTLFASSVVAGGLVGCSAGPPGVYVTFQNLSTSEVLAVARVSDTAGGTSPQTQEVRIASGAEQQIRFEGASDRDGVQVRVAPESNPLGGTTPLLLDPPGPYLMRVQGNASSLSMMRMNRPIDEPSRIPPDPSSRGFNDDIGPINPSR